ncbi:hypothetical protein [Cytobacillus gottheilii]|uniref:Conjugal transfer protein n=1 Tax=Cytobacillus gottheilii TaxID=859144 RepID=A0ABX8FIT6_9BACI|nr:hypothetical protein [Cytobacillus gottheilii]QVY63949.1 hypothetical protein J1899_22510 [Cytobacillus gottheilii]
MRNKRTLPHNVDGRLKVGPFPIKNFFMWIPLPAIFIFIFFKVPGELSLMLNIIGIGLSAIPFMEFRFKQTGGHFLKELIIYDLRGLLADFFPEVIKQKHVQFERSMVDDTILEKFTFNEKTFEINERKRRKIKEREAIQSIPDNLH